MLLSNISAYQPPWDQSGVQKVRFTIIDTGLVLLDVRLTDYSLQQDLLY